MSNFLIGRDLYDAHVETFTGDASDTAFTLANSTTTNACIVRINGVVQRNGTDFTVSGTTITFTTAPPNASNNIVVQYFGVGAINVPADNSVTLAKLAPGTDGNVISYDASGNPVAVATGSDGQVLTSTGAGSPPAFEALPSSGFTQGTEQATASGTGVTFGSIPTGVSLILINFEEVSLNSTTGSFITIGDSGGLETSGYIASSTYLRDGAAISVTASTAGFWIRNTWSTHVVSGTMTLALKDSANFTWVASHTFKALTNFIIVGGGAKSLSGELTQLALSGGTFDSGSINIMYQ
jgi:hypothetical protein